jgi:molybdopterin synthase sulfur carrier subunit
MRIQVRFFASLRETIGRSDVKLNSASIHTAADVWQVATDGQSMPTNTLIAINMEYADAGQTVQDGDEVAFFPPVTGGSR